jgi:hypothetical protein
MGKISSGKKVSAFLEAGGFEFYFLMSCRHTASAPITAGKYTGGVQ